MFSRLFLNETDEDSIQVLLFFFYQISVLFRILQSDL